MKIEDIIIRKECIGIVNQLFDLAEVPVEKRQEINDKADKYLLDQVLRLRNSSQLLLCIDDALEERLTIGEKYKIINEDKGKYLIEDDLGYTAWYCKLRFMVVAQ